MKKGFTLVELMAVVILLLVVISIAVPNMLRISKDRKQQLYESKLVEIETHATTWGKDHIDSLSDKCECISVSELINLRYLSGDNKERDTIFDPRYNNSMNALNVCVTYDASVDRVYAKVFEAGQDDSECYN